MFLAAARTGGGPAKTLSWYSPERQTGEDAMERNQRCFTVHRAHHGHPLVEHRQDRVGLFEWQADGDAVDAGVPVALHLVDVRLLMPILSASRPASAHIWRKRGKADEKDSG